MAAPEQKSVGEMAAQELEISMLRSFQEFNKGCDCAGHILAKETCENFDSGQAPYKMGTTAEVLTLHNAQGEIDNAIANAFIHFLMPGGNTGRYHDSMCGGSLHWTHMAQYRLDDPDQKARAIEKVTCPICLEVMQEQGLIQRREKDIEPGSTDDKRG